MRDEKCRAVAKAMADLLRPSASSGKKARELSLIQVFGLGFLMVVAGGGESLNPAPREKTVEPLFLSIAFDFDANPAILEDYFCSIVSASQSDPEDLLRRFEATCNEVRSKAQLRLLLRNAVKSIPSAERAGRPSKMTHDDWPEFMRLSQQLVPLCAALTTVHRSAKKRGLKDHLDYLRLDYPEQVSFLTEHLPKAQQVLNDKALLAIFKTDKTRAQKLADIFAGFKFGVSPQYAMQQALAARRSS